MNITVHKSKYTVEKATKADKKELLRFYKTQRYSARFIGQDHCYIVKINNHIIASAMISGGQVSDNFWLLHALVTVKAEQGKSIASLILQTIINDEHENENARYENIICFIDSELQQFYIKNNFSKYNTKDEIASLPVEFKQRLIRYREKQHNLHCYLYSHNK
ncbi:GNAT family N-acetyltransferase [Cognaticolwellia beringensis]|uniref:N-acetyltransferase n=1 Tax=Cognaticolwellia beringensis TaxID=1967665 RepID=A0A222G704_9GAMM|nr:GNAT family N-acetyltransferase [Cognaticolwellia beringensis]ASP47383.1 N-acetyltransferase [Cognaticolwellia beringensis]